MVSCTVRLLYQVQYNNAVRLSWHFSVNLSLSFLRMYIRTRSARCGSPAVISDNTIHDAPSLSRLIRVQHTINNGITVLRVLDHTCYLVQQYHTMIW